MGMSHDACTHPRTPAGRAACRKAGGPQGVHDTTTREGLDEMLRTEPKPRKKAAVVTKVAPAPRPRKVTEAPAPTNDDEAFRARKARVAQTTDDRTTKQRMDSLWGGTTRRSYIRAEHDMADVPHVFSNVIRYAWEQGWDVWRGDPYNETERRLVIGTTYGTGQLVWKVKNPDGINGQFWRPVHTSITTRVPSVNELLRIMKEMS